MKVKFESTAFESLEPGDRFKRVPYAGDAAREYVKVEESVSINGKGIYNAICITGENLKKQMNPKTNVFKIQRFGNEEEV